MCEIPGVCVLGKSICELTNTERCPLETGK